MNNKWYVLTGGPSTGKTTLLAALENRGYLVVPEAARTIIDETLAHGIPVEELRSDEKKFQEDVARRKEAIEGSLDPDVITFFDRGMQDTTAYLIANNLAIEPWVEALTTKATYKKVFLLEPVAFVSDYARTENEAFTKKIHTLLADAYSEHGIEVVAVPPLSVNDRVEFILHRINQEGVKT